MGRLAAANYHLGALQEQQFNFAQIWVARCADAAAVAQPQAKVRIESMDQAEVRALLAALDREQDRLLRPAPSTRRNAAAALRRATIRLAVVRDAQSQVIACGALLLQDDGAELSQLMVQPSRRGQGLGQMLLAKLEGEAIRAGSPLLRLEADVRQHAAQGLSERNGFRRCGPFSGRPGSHFSVFMEKLLNSA